ncbi:MAG: hypothetical protein FRX49_13790 [Trebouxia sp. A1-2]|nr:MAG: hypothetical protein FRX49_13790 [Trebouxia sp. A1-2]
MSMLRQKKLGPHRSDLFTEIFYTSHILRNQALGQFEHSFKGGLQGSFALSRATAESILSDDITVADIVVWELSLSFASGLEHCSGRYKAAQVHQCAMIYSNHHDTVCPSLVLKNNSSGTKTHRSLGAPNPSWDKPEKDWVKVEPGAIWVWGPSCDIGPPAATPLADACEDLGPLPSAPDLLQANTKLALYPSLPETGWLLGWREGVTSVVGLSVLRRCSGGSGRVARGDAILTGSLAGKMSAEMSGTKRLDWLPPSPNRRLSTGLHPLGLGELLHGLLQVLRAPPPGTGLLEVVQ